MGSEMCIRDSRSSRPPPSRAARWRARLRLPAPRPTLAYIDFGMVSRVPLEVREAAAEVFEVDAAQVLVCNGYDDCLTVVMRSFLAAGDLVACTWPTYSPPSSTHFWTKRFTWGPTNCIL